VLTALGEGYRVVLVYGVDEELGGALTRAEERANEGPMPPLYDILAAAAGVVGQRLVTEVNNELRRARAERPVTCVLAHVLVGPLESDEGAAASPVGPAYSAPRARELARDLGWRVIQETSGAWRRVVARPDPLDVFELDSISALVAAGHVVVTAGGGGVPVHIDARRGVGACEALLSPARTASLLATHLDADVLAVLDAGEGILLDSDRASKRPLDVASATELAALVREGRVAPAQRDAALAVADFVSEGGAVGLVASGERLSAALAGRAGTRVTRAGDPSTPRRQIALPLEDLRDGDTFPEAAPPHKESLS